MAHRRVGLWLIGALGGVGSTVALGLAALRRGLSDSTSLVTALPLFKEVDLDAPESFVVGGHDIRQSNFHTCANELHARANVFDVPMLNACKPELDAWSENVRPGTVIGSGAAIDRLVELAESRRPESPQAALERIRRDLADFRIRHKLDQVVVVSVASTEPPFELSDRHSSIEGLRAALEKDADMLPASAIYAWAAIDLGLPYVNFTPSLGASVPALESLATERRSALAGKDGKTGETLLKSVLAPMFAARNLRILSWVGHNIFGNRDGQVLDDPRNKESKIRTKDQVISGIVGYKPQTHVSIEYIESLDDWKTAWDHIHFRGFLGVKMTMQFIWQGCDSLLAAPLVVDLARLALLAERRGETGILPYLACFFKSPMGVSVQDFSTQFEMLERHVQTLTGAGRERA